MPLLLSASQKYKKTFPDRIWVDFVIAPGETIYARTQIQRARAAFLSNAAQFFADRGAAVRWLVPLSPESVYQFEAFFSKAQALHVEAVITIVDGVELSRNDQLFAADFIRYHILEDKNGCLGVAARRGYEALLGELDGCQTSRNDEIFLSILQSKPKAMRARQESGRFAFIVEAAGVLIDGARAHFRRALLFGTKRDEAARSARLNQVLLIGAYGGEHIGDAAILGGVVLRLHQRQGVENAILLSQRPAHTRHLIPMIDTPVNIEVREYLHAEIDACIDDVDAVVFAGGPIVDLPKQLVRHLYAVSKAKARGKPFIMEGVGPGPLSRLPSRATARQIVSLADYISVRTKDSADAAIMNGLNVEVGRDPAFDYLETRQGDLSKMQPNETAALERLLDGVGDRPVIGVNIRPIYHQYTVGVKDAEKAAYTQMVEDRFERRLAKALSEFNAQSPKKPVSYFFP